MGKRSQLYKSKDYPTEYLTASAISAAINYPLWRASAIGQSGFVVQQPPPSAAAKAATVVTSSIGIGSGGRGGTILQWPNALLPYRYAFLPPYKGAMATVLGMTWARAAIFFGSDVGRDIIKEHGYNTQIATIVPPLTISTIVQCINQPLVRATITIQNPQSTLGTVWQALQYIYTHHGWSGLWHGTSAGILKTVPKYCTAVIVKDLMEDLLPLPSQDDNSHRRNGSNNDNEHDNRTLWLLRSAIKSMAAGLAGAVLTNPLDVVRNEMFKTNCSLVQTIQHLQHTESSSQWMARGLGKNMIAVTVPVACTIFFTDALIQYSILTSNRES